MNLLGVLDPRSEVHDALKADSQGLHAGLCVTLAPEEAAQPRD